MKSMTAFARIDHATPIGNFCWELRSVNQRYLETYVRLGEDYRFLEQEVREKINQKLSRGKVECSLRLDLSLYKEVSIGINEPLVESIIAALDKIGSMLGQSKTHTAIDILTMPNVIQKPSLDLKEINKQALLALDLALDKLIVTREQEGQRIMHMLLPKLEQIAKIIATVKKMRPELIQTIRKKTHARVQELIDNPDCERIEQELVLLAQKLDVTEELDRLEAHVAEVFAVFKRQEPIGRRLDFLMQELNREANTLAAKSNHAPTTAHSVDLKVLIEQIREQVQNIE